MCGSAVSKVVETVLSPILPEPPKPQKPPKPAPPPPPIPAPPPPPPPPTPGAAQPLIQPTAQAPIIGGQRDQKAGSAGAGRGSLVIPISLGGVGGGGTGLSIPR